MRAGVNSGSAITALTILGSRTLGTGCSEAFLIGQVSMDLQPAQQGTALGGVAGPLRQDNAVQDMSKDNHLKESDRIVETDIPARLDALHWSGFHTRVVVALGVTWIL